MKQLKAFVIYGFIAITFVMCGKRDQQPGYKILGPGFQGLAGKSIALKGPAGVSFEKYASNFMNISQALPYVGWTGIAVATYKFSDYMVSNSEEIGEGCLLPSEFFDPIFFAQNKENMIAFLLNNYPGYGDYAYWDWILEEAFVDGCNPERDLNQPEILTYFSLAEDDE